MSEKVDLELNNLCIPEDAFEQFQAISMYQEEEIIILPEKEPAKPKGPDPGELNQHSYGNEVNMTTENAVNSSVIDSTEETKSSKQSLNNSSLPSSACIDHVQNVLDQGNQPAPVSRRGRKKKQLNNDANVYPSNCTVLGSIQNTDDTQNSELESPLISSSVVPRKRGRKPKPKPVPPIDIQSEVTTKTQNQEVLNIFTTPFSTDPENSETATIVVKKKRGRPPKLRRGPKPKKLSLQANPDSQIKLKRNPPNDLICLEDLNAVDLNKTKLIKGKTKQSLELDLAKIDTDDKHKSSDSDGKQELYPNDKLQSDSDLILKSNSDVSLKSDSHNNILIDGSNSENDDLDDISLSKLKQLPESSKPVDEHFCNENNKNLTSDINSYNINFNPPVKKGRKSKPKNVPVKSNENSLIESTTSDEVTCLEITQNATQVECTQIDDDETDDLSLSQLKEVKSIANTENNNTTQVGTTQVGTTETQITEIESSVDQVVETPTKRNTKMPVMSDFEYNLDSVLGESTVNDGYTDNSLLVEDTSKRPIRRKVPKLRYEEESDEDPFANVELSDDEPRRRKGNKYYSDDEYIPGRRGNKDIDSTDSEAKELLDEVKIQRRKKLRKKSDNQSPRKKGKNNDTNQDVESDDIEICLQPIVTKANEDFQLQPSKTWGTSNEFENFIAKKIQGTNLQIKKLSSTEPTENKVLEIPVIDPEAKKTVEMCSQTSFVNTVSASVQTGTPYDTPMKENITLTPEQSEKACFFLNSIVKTTSELGTLMTQKSEDFIKKKINTTHVTDTMKMDYCVKKSFLLFKLAKHNLMQMEEDLAKQYDEFLESNNLTQCREIQQKVVPSAKPVSSDSDCEIVEDTTPIKATTSKKSQGKPKFNPKTVFLNKELSIKIAKKPTENKKLDIKGRHTVWINDTVMVKKVKPMQSFLAQDSRNKKPPDNKITRKMVSDFFKNYYRQRALSVCSPFVAPDWLNVSKECVCSYFVVKPVCSKDQFNNVTNYSEHGGISMNNAASNAGASDTNHDLNAVKCVDKNTVKTYPETLFKLCFWIVQNQMHDLNQVKEVCLHIQNELTDEKYEPVTLFRLSLRALTGKAVDITERSLTSSRKTHSHDTSQLTVLPLKTLCHQRIVGILSDSSKNDSSRDPLSLRALTPITVDIIERSLTSSRKAHSHDTSQLTVLPLKTLCHQRTVHILSDSSKNDSNRDQLFLRVLTPTTVDIMERRPTSSKGTHPHNSSQITVLPLKMLCHQRIVALLSDSTKNDSVSELVVESSFSTEESNDNSPTCFSKYVSPLSNIRNEMKSLLSICVEFIQRKQIIETSNISILIPKSLKHIAFEYVKHSLYKELKGDLLKTGWFNLNQQNKHNTIEGLTINSVNTLSEEAFLNLDHADIPDSPDYLDDFDNGDHFDPDLTDPEENNQTETSWVNQVQMQELRSCFNTTNSDLNQGENVSIITQIKLEPLDDMPENVDSSAFVKIEPVPGLDEMTMIPDIKPEVEQMVTGPIQRQNSNSYDVETFEKFVSSNKLMHELNAEDIFSQSALRVRRQHEPDYDEENDTSMSLLIPQTYEPLTIETAKGSLMESSSDEENSKSKKVMGKKKLDKRNKGKQKKPELKTNNKETSTLIKDKPSINEVATLTRRMRDRIRQEEKKDDSTDSESENILVRLRNKKDQDKIKPGQVNKAKECEIQCNNVDSTDQVEDDVPTFTGFSAIDQNEISTYQKYMKYVYDKLIPEQEKDTNLKKDIVGVEEKVYSEAPIINPEEPVELLECEPTMPIFDDLIEKKSKRKTKTKPDKYKKEDSPQQKEILKEALLSQAETLKKDVMTEEAVQKESDAFIDRHGWQCYPVNIEDSKLCQSAYVALEKLPESFVQTYFEYQGITGKDENDIEINRLTNLNSLNRTVQLKDMKAKTKSKNEAKGDRIAGNVSETGSRAESPSFTDNDGFDELEPSDDEGARVEDEVAPPVVQKQTENILAKNLLMGDNDSDSDEAGIKVKQEPSDGAKGLKGKCKPSIKPKTKEDVSVDNADLMLTADKMMNKELALLHAPIVLNDDVKDTSSKGPMTRNKQKSATKNPSSGSKIKNEDHSSSEEEKQWVTTKEKLLKRLGKKEDASADDAKRAKLVSEFIERRTDFPDAHKRSRAKSRRSVKKFLERQKQLRVLSRELFGESSDAMMSKRSQKAQASLLYKGRRNIRKVIDKKSLARSTVVANMEEFERKRRLNSKQTQLRELLGCEEGVNVLVINDEVCLEYDFEENRPVVTIHPFFTKVMKAHQYEGVKFMWDACFESLAEIKSGHPGGGCILAHCMGLGKTLQVLALLHTVLTHPGVGMQRILVCCPLSTVLNWVDEIHKWIGPVTNQIKVFELSKLKKTYERAYQLEDWYNGGGIFIIGYELFRSLSTLDPFLDDVRPTIINKIRTALLDPGPDIIVCDEGHLLKNDCSVLAVAMSRVVTKRRIILTGTPMQNNLREYYCMVNFVKPNLLGTYAEYSNRFENPIMNGQHRDSREEDIKLMKARTHILHKVLEGCLQRQEASVLYPYLPKKHEYTVFITLTPCQWDLYKHYLNHYGKQAKQSILKDFHILQKIWSHPQVLHNFQTKARDRDEKNRIKAEKLEDDLATEDLEEIKPNTACEDLWWLEYLDGGNMLETLDSSNKFVVVFRILEECVALGDKVLIFSTSLFCLDALEYFLKKINKWSLGQEYYRLDGSVPPEVRQKWCREFNADNNYKTKLFLVSTRAGCLGLNMTAANRVIIMDTSWNPAHDIQSIFRVYRFGQKKDCYIYRLVAMGTMEQKIYERSVTKQAVACRVVDEQQIDRHYNMAELTELYKYDDLGESVEGGVAVGVHDVALLRVARETALHAVHEHDSLLRGSSEQGLPEHERNAAWMQFQQEQAHKQMENKLVMHVPQVPKVALKRVHGDDYTATITTPTEIKTETKGDEDYKPNEPKVKKGKKGLIKCCIPIQDSSNSSENSSIKDEEHTSVNNEVQKTTRARGRPRKSTSLAIPGTSTDTILEAPIDQNQEEIMVERITDILLRHNFQNRKGHSEISKLVMKVRTMVKKGYVDADDQTDDLTASIAQILLPKQVPLPKVTDIMCESINNSAANITPITPPDDNPEVITSDPTPRIPTISQYQEEIQNEPELRTKRKAAIVAAKNMDSLSNDVVINLDDDDWDSRDADFVPNSNDTEKLRNVVNNRGKRKTKPVNGPQRIVDDDESTRSADPSPDRTDTGFDYDITPSTSDLHKENNINHSKQMSNTENPKEVSKSYSNRKRNVNQAYKAIFNESIKNKSSESNSNSILLSDDDDEVLSNLQTSDKSTERSPEKPLEKPPVRLAAKKATENFPEKPQGKEPPENDEIVPLPMQLLRNQNFINIVAHTYLVGNPMLDEDAATLAAQYSTLKAYKEAEQTGKDLCSGPIYDIAVKVIGKEILKKMRSVNNKTALSSVNDAAASIQMKERMINSKKSQEPANSSESKLRNALIKEKLAMQMPVSEPVTTISLMGDPHRNNTKKVVPVGLIKTAASMSANESFDQPGVECILPDDDDVIISDCRSSPPEHVPAPPALVPAPPALVPAPPRPSRPISPAPRPAQSPQPVILNHVLFRSKKTEVHPVRVTVGSAPTAPPPKSDTTSKLVVYPFTRPTPSKTPITAGKHSLNVPTPIVAQQILPNDNTICLDSDEEETVTSATYSSSSGSQSVQQQVQPPVPVSLTMAHAPGVKLPLPPMTNLVPNTSRIIPCPAHQVPNSAHVLPLPPHLVPNTSHITPNSQHQVQITSHPASVPVTTQPHPKQTLLLRQVVTPGTQPKYVLIPSDKLPIPTLPKTTVSTQQQPVAQTQQNYLALPNELISPIKEPVAEQTGNTIDKTRCKPGDILRISKTGQIEVINRNDINVVGASPSVSVDLTGATTSIVNTKPQINQKSIHTKTYGSVTVKNPKQAKKPTIISESFDLTNVTNEVTTPKPAPLQQKKPAPRSVRAISSSSSSSSSSSRASSENPLSILKDVVHIRAADYPSTSSGTKKSNSKSIVLRTEKCSNSNISVQHVVSTESKKTIADKLNSLKAGAMKLTKVPKNQVPKHVDLALDKQMKKDNVGQRIRPPVKNQPKVEEPKRTGKNSVNLDNYNKTLLKNKSIVGRTDKADNSQTLKGKPDSKTNFSKPTPTVDLTNLVIPGTTLLKAKSEMKKRPSTIAETPPVKKKKSEPMTLKDFNLDDIDDIIELE